MQAIEFTYESDDGMIKVPEQYKNWIKKSVKVILLWQEPPHSEKISPKTRRIPKGAGCYHSGRSDISQRAEELLFQQESK